MNVQMLAAAVPAVLALVLATVILLRVNRLAARLPPASDAETVSRMLAAHHESVLARFAVIEDELDALQRLARRSPEPTASQPPLPPAPAVAGPPVPSFWRDSGAGNPAPPAPPRQSTALPLTPPLPTPQPFAFAPPAPTPPAEPPPPDPGQRSAAVLARYRELLPQPQRAEINRWADELGGVSVEVGDDGHFRRLPREAGGLLVAVPIDDATAIVVPGGRLVVDFSTSYTSTLALRPLIKETFGLVTDGGGVMRLVEPALAVFDGDGWRLTKPGCISGLVD